MLGLKLTGKLPFREVRLAGAPYCPRILPPAPLNASCPCLPGLPPRCGTGRPRAQDEQVPGQRH